MILYTCSIVDGFHDMFTGKILFNFPVWSRLGQFHRQLRRKAKVERARWRTLRKRHPSEASRIVGKILVKWERLNEIQSFRELQELIQSAVFVQCSNQSGQRLEVLDLLLTLRHPKGGPGAKLNSCCTHQGSTAHYLLILTMEKASHSPHRVTPQSPQILLEKHAWVWNFPSSPGQFFSK